MAGARSHHNVMPWVRPSCRARTSVSAGKIRSRSAIISDFASGISSVSAGSSQKSATSAAIFMSESFVGHESSFIT